MHDWGRGQRGSTGSKARRFWIGQREEGSTEGRPPRGTEGRARCTPTHLFSLFFLSLDFNLALPLSYCPQIVESPCDSVL